MLQPETATADRIARAAWEAAARRLPGLPREGGFCLKLVRLVVEAALGLPPHGMYERWLVAGTSRRKGSDAERAAAARQDPWAADLEASMKTLSLGVPFAERRPGDLLFNHRAAEPYGHVAVLLDRDTVLENVELAFRPKSVRLGEALVLTRVSDLPWTLCARLR
ncbi:MAG TPA: hypothetical protein VF158_04825 [Longimicrobiales bacterium]